MTSLLLDTHAMLWFFWEDPLLSKAAKAAIEDPSNRKLVSIASCWEVAIKTAVKKLDLGEPCDTYLSRELANNNFELLPIDFRHVTAVANLKPHHRDPFDRLLVIQATLEHFTVVSSDEVFDAYGVTRLW